MKYICEKCGKIFTTTVDIYCGRDGKHFHYKRFGREICGRVVKFAGKEKNVPTAKE